MTSIKDVWGRLTDWAWGTANTVVSANVSVVVDPVVKTTTTVVKTVSNTATTVVHKVGDVAEETGHRVSDAYHDLAGKPKAPRPPKKKGRKKKDQ